MELAKEDVREAQASGAQAQRERINDSVERSKDYEEGRIGLSSRTYEAIEKNVNQIAEKREKQFEIIDAGRKLQSSKIEDTEVDRKIHNRNAERYSTEGYKKVKDANYEIETFKKNQSQLELEKAKGSREGKTEMLEREKEKVNSFYAMRNSEQSDKNKDAKATLESIERHNKKPGANDLARNPLADQYPQGITEDKVVENGQVILTRYVVVGNKVDVFKKVIGMNSTYYFHNGVSCTQATWDRESTVILE